MIVYPAEHKHDKNAVFDALCSVAGGGRRLAVIPVRFSDYPETKHRTASALARAKRQPKSRALRWVKQQMLRGQYNWARHYFTAHPDHIAAAWNGLTGSRMAFMQGAADAGAGRLYVERAPFPGRVTIDPLGVNAESSVPQDPAFYRALPLDPDWRAAGADIVSRPSRRADVGQSASTLPETPYLFCPLQVPNDSQVTLFSGWTGGMAGFLAALQQAAQKLPDGWHLRLKEHPSARKSLADDLAPLLATGRIILDNSTDSFAQVGGSRGVVTLNSSMGLQSFFFDKPVICLGLSLFAIDGLVTVAGSQADLNAAFSAPDALGFDADLRGQFVGWLLSDYYPAFQYTRDGVTFDRAAFTQKLALASHQ